MTSNNWFTNARYGLFIHYGLYSLLERGEWVWNREEIPLEEYNQLAARFTAKDFDADKLCRMAVDAGMRYVVLTTMHHEGSTGFSREENWSPDYGVVAEGLRNVVIKDNVMDSGALKELILDRGGHGPGVLIKDNPGDLFQKPTP